jgi:hypothetical protein
VGFFAFMMTIVIAILVLVGGLRLLQAGDRRPRALPPSVAPERLERIEAALAALDARLDVLQEQQEFVERLLEKRREHPSLPPADAPPSSDSILFDVEEDEV